MAIYDCFQYFDEDQMVDLRLNILDKYVDYFVISESTKTHQGKSKKINFDINNFSKFKNKIRFVIADYDKKIDFQNHTGGESPIEQHQRNFLIEGTKDASPDDLIILSDSDEIPDLTKLKNINKNKKFVAFSQKMFMYKLNLQNLNESNWIGSKITKKKYIKSMQSLRNLKFKDYPFWRIDKYNLQIINGGWHFSYLQTPQQILTKIKSFSHGEFNNKNISEKSIEEKIFKNEDIFGRGTTLKKIELDSSYPEYIFKNKHKFLEWTI
jgi:beta-1,4-mannosyl-glycoprotein beta-1,4-N-acetylglucosaminyltransferase|tara:strand:+ start:1191 stop:1991 length:801 start_codon:yes stop_codon:yes gene_type:complete